MTMHECAGRRTDRRCGCRLGKGIFIGLWAFILNGVDAAEYALIGASEAVVEKYPETSRNQLN